MRIRISKPGIYGANGMIPVGTELTLKEEPKAWAGRYDVISGGGKTRTAVTNPAEGAQPNENEGGNTSLDDMTVAELRDYAAARNIELGDASRKDDIRAAIVLAEQG